PDPVHILQRYCQLLSPSATKPRWCHSRCEGWPKAYRRTSQILGSPSCRSARRGKISRKASQLRQGCQNMVPCEQYTISGPEYSSTKTRQQGPGPYPTGSC